MNPDDKLKEDLVKNYNDRADIFLQEENHFKRKSKIISSFRLLLGILTLVGIWMFTIYPAAYWLVLSSLSFISFFVVVVLDGKTNKKRQYFHRLRTINEQESATLNGKSASLTTGSLYSSQDHAYAYDLDIFGAGSLFQMINRTCTPSGEKLLVDHLSNPDLQTQHILQRQKAIAELMPLQDFRQQFMVTGQENSETPNDILQLNLWLNSANSKLNNPVIATFRFILPAVTLILLLLAVFGIISYFFVPVSILINMAFLQLYRSQINKIHAVVSHKHHILNKYAKLLKHLNDQTFSSEILTSLRRDGKDADSSLNALSKTMSFFDQRLNDLVAIVLNGIFLSDFHCVIALDRWKQTHKNQMPQWLDNIFLMDELNSFANFAFNNPDYTYPTFSDTIFFEAENLGHPLIRDHECIKNNFSSSAEEKVIVLTGANMSGKSTFLRSMGINLILAYSGAPVYATKLVCNKTTVYTSMRVTDSLGQDTSYFYAELKRLSAIVKNLREGTKMLVLLDEILKGTNSDDKLLGSIGLIEEFLQYDCLCLIATHDLALGELENKYPKQISNYCFESELNSDQLTFDYTIKRGIAKNKNATFLMRKEGLIK